MKVSEGTLRDPKWLQAGACDVWNYENKWKICVKAEKGEFAKGNIVPADRSKNEQNMCKTRQSSIVLAKVDKLKCAGAP